MATRDVFSAEELEQLRRFPEVDRAELIRYFTLTPADKAFVRQFRGQGNVLGASVQLCTLPWLGFVPDDVPAAPAPAVARLSQRLGIPIGELRSYGTRGQTRTEHFRQIVAYAGWRSMDAAEWKGLDEFLFARAMEHDSPKLLFRLACEYLVSSRIVQRGVVTVLEHVATARASAGGDLDPHRASAHRTAGIDLDGLLVSDPELGRTRLLWLGVGPTWTTEYHGLAVAALRRSVRWINDEVLAHIQPTHHENVHFYGTHSVDIDGELAKLDADGYRPLRTQAG